MQTPAEKFLVGHLISLLETNPEHVVDPPRILNIGAGSSASIESQLTGAGCEYVCDRIDVVDCTVSHPAVGECLRGSVEDMTAVPSAFYVAAFANFVLEHVRDPRSAAMEIHRVLRPAGRFVASVPNPAAPEFVLARRTPLWLHRLVRGTDAWETHYAFRSIQGLTAIFEDVGFETVQVRYQSFIEGYLGRFWILGKIARAYDRVVSARGLRRLMGNVCIVFEKR